jgi:UDPglucose 6-dehydrogenase
MTNPIVGFAGLTHLGINSQFAAAARGFNTVGFHPDEELVVRLGSGVFPIHEPGLSKLFDEHRQRLRFSADTRILGECDLVYVSVDVPTDSQGRSDLEVVEQMIGMIKPLLQEDALLVVLCQVPPGFTRNIGFPARRLYYQVETLIFGRAVERALYPERFIVGCLDPNEPLPPPLVTYLSAFECPVLPMRYESAELAKVSINMCLVSSVSVANTMAELCENVGADWSEVVPALRLDKRIGQFAYLKPGLGIAGGNLERDLATVVQLASKRGSNAEVVKAWITDSAYRKDWVLRCIDKIEQSGSSLNSVGVLGLAYKENTASIKNSAAVDLLQTLVKKGKNCRIAAYDPEVTIESVPVEGVSYVKTALEACRNANIVALMTPWPEFGQLEPAQIAAEMKGNILVDPYRILDPKQCAVAGLGHITLGRPYDQNICKR